MAEGKIINEAYELFEKFKNDVKYKNRYFIDDEIKDIFDDIIEQSKELIPLEEVLYRARIHREENEEKPFRGKQIGMPENKYCGNGRVNPKGMQVFYLAGSKDTVISEIRPNIGDEITIGMFKTTQYLQVLKIDQDGACHGYCEAEQSKSGKNRNFLLMFATYFNLDFSKPIKANERDLEYLPTQIFAEYCKSKDIDGIAYPSSVVEKDFISSKEIKPNYNYVFFSDKGIEYVSSELVIIEKINYKYKLFE